MADLTLIYLLKPYSMEGFVTYHPMLAYPYKLTPKISYKQLQELTQCHSLELRINFNHFN
jgi:hypothetical protein